MDEHPDPLAEPEGYGKPRRSDTPANQPEHECSRTCEMDTGSGKLCGKPSAWHIEVRDVNEHFRAADYCPGCVLYHDTAVLECQTCKNVSRVNTLKGLPKVDYHMVVTEKRLLPWAPAEKDRVSQIMDRVLGSQDET